MDDGMTNLIMAAGLFVLGHFGLSSTPLRGVLLKPLGGKAYMGIYSLIALGAVVWMVRSYGDAPQNMLWEPGFLDVLPLVVMPFALILVVAGYTSRNPTSLGQDGALKSKTPARGIVRVTRHPGLWGIGLWAAAHILAKGDGASLVFFGAFLVVSVLGTVLLDRRRRSTAGENWEKFAAVTSILPFAAILSGRNQFVFGEIGLWRVAVGLALYAILVVGHLFMFGVDAY